MLSPSELTGLAQSLDPNAPVSKAELDHEELIEKLDYKYIETCSNAKELEEMILVLRSGKEGSYPHLLEFTENRLKEVDPSKWLSLRKPEKASKATGELRDALIDDLANWSTELKKEENSLLSRPLQSSVPNASRFNETQRRYLAERENTKGNDAVKSGDFQEALTYYTKSLEMYPQARVYSNRALVQSKLKQPKMSIEDATKAIALDNSFYKAYIRRANAYQYVGQYMNAIEDCLSAEKILLAEPIPKTTHATLPLSLDGQVTTTQATLNQVRQLRRACETKYLDVEGQRSLPLPEGCSEEARLRQRELKSSEVTTHRLQIIESEDEENEIEAEKEETKEEAEFEPIQIEEVEEEVEEHVTKPVENQDVWEEVHHNDEPDVSSKPEPSPVRLSYASKMWHSQNSSVRITPMTQEEIENDNKPSLLSESTKTTARRPGLIQEL